MNANARVKVSLKTLEELLKLAYRIQAPSRFDEPDFEVVEVRRTDMDWEGGEISIFVKSSRHTLPEGCPIPVVGIADL